MDLASYRTIIISRLFVWTISSIFGSLVLFDASPRIIQTSGLSQSLLRWDAFHFLHIAQNGYVYEHEWAFFPGLPFLMRHAARLAGTSDPLLAGATAAVVVDGTRVLHELSLLHLRSPALASLATALSILPSSPATLKLAAYTEPFFTYLSYRGMLYAGKSQWHRATVAFTMAALFRSNGILLAGYLVWGMLCKPFLETKKVPSTLNVFHAFFLTLATFSPFLYHQYAGYSAFCSEPISSQAWCSNKIPFIYSHVQSKYWNSGFLKYWTVAQSPNIAIGLPPLALTVCFSVHHFRRSAHGPFRSLDLTPHAIHGLLLAAILLFASHTQIALRFAASLPLTYWAAAWLLMEHPRIGAWWIGWSLVWGLLSVALWGAFLPPA